MKLRQICLAALILCASTLGLHATNPSVNVSLLDTETVPYPFNYVSTLANGDLQFYTLEELSGGISISGFRFSRESSILTAPGQIAYIPADTGVYSLVTYTERFGKSFLVYRYEIGNVLQGIAVLKLSGNNAEFRLINDLPFDAFFSPLFSLEIVAENSLVLALADSLVYRDFESGSNRTLLSGEQYQCAPLQYKRVYTTPEGHFFYIKDTQGGAEYVPEVWMVFDAQGNYLFTKTIADSYVKNCAVGTTFTDGFQTGSNRFYISNPLLIYEDGWLECSFPSPDSLDLYSFRAPNTMGQFYSGFMGFGSDRVLASSYIDVSEPSLLIITLLNSPIADGIPGGDMLYTGVDYISLCSINDNLLTLCRRAQNSIEVRVLWALDYPADHSFSFPAPPLSGPAWCITLAEGNVLYALNHNALQVFGVETSVANSDPIEVPVSNHLSAYPNPVRQSHGVSIASTAKHVFTLEVYNIKGQLVRRLTTDNEGKTSWDLRDDDGTKLGAGLYIAKPAEEQGMAPIKIVVVQ